MTKPDTRIKAATQIATNVLTGIGCSTEMGVSTLDDELLEGAGGDAEVEFVRLGF